jgi:hypothetical protein
LDDEPNPFCRKHFGEFICPGRIVEVPVAGGEAGGQVVRSVGFHRGAADLATRCHRAAIEGRWDTTMRFFAGPALLVIDELGYLPLAAEADSVLFQFVSQSY